MEDFYQSLKDNLENRPEPDFKEGAWLDLDGRLDALQKKEGRVVVWPWWSYAALALLPLSILLNGWLFLRQGDAQPQEDKLAGVDHILLDTVYQTRIVYQRDTILRTIVREQEKNHTDYAYYWKANAERELAKWEGRFVPEVLEGGVPVDDGSISSLLVELGDNPMQQLLRKAGLGQNALLAQDESNVSTPVHQLEGLNFVLEDSKPVLLRGLRPLNVPSFTTSPTPFWETIRPVGLRMGVELGLYHPFMDDTEDEFALYRGIDLGILLPNHFEIWAQVGLLQVNYQFDEMGDEYGIPIIEGPSNDYEFKYVKVAQERLNFAAGLQYSFTSKNSRWRPTIGLGYAALSFLPYELYYEFEEPGTDTEIKLEEQLKRSDGPYGYAVTRVGLRMPFNRRWNVGLMGEFKYSLSNDRFTNPHLLGLTGALSYQF